MVPVLKEITVFPESDCWLMENNQESPKLNKCSINSNREGNIRLSQKKEHFPSLGSHFIHPSHSCQVNLLWGKGPIKESHNFTTERGSRCHLIHCPYSTGEDTDACLRLHSWLIYATLHNYILSPTRCHTYPKRQGGRNDTQTWDGDFSKTPFYSQLMVPKVQAGWAEVQAPKTEFSP